MPIHALTVQNKFTPQAHDIVVIGTGPVGIHLVQKLRQLNDKLSIAVFGDEPWQPYNRVKLSSLLIGEINENQIYQSMDVSELSEVRCFYNTRITKINQLKKEVIDDVGNHHSYKHLVLATGSTAHIPSIEGVNLKNVYTFRHLNDAVKLMGRSVRTRHTVIIGGGLLGLEAARAMQRFNTQVTIIEHNMWLMFNQLDHHSGSFLKHYIESLNIGVHTSVRVQAIMGEHEVKGVKLSNGEIIECDTVILAAGIKPNIELAFDASLHISKGIRVNDQLQTSDINISAIGECAEHRNMVYGLVAPGFEQADVLAHLLDGNTAQYSGTITATKLKVLDYPVFSMGNINASVRKREQFVYHDNKNEIYRKLIVINGRLRGVIAIGSWPGVNRIQQAVSKNSRIWPWQLSRFLKEGSLWDEDDAVNIHLWPSATVVCNCTGVTKGMLSNARSKGACSIVQLAKETGASTVCGTCKPLIANFIGGNAKSEPVKAHLSLLSASVISIIAILVLFFIPGTPYSDTVQVNINWDNLWRESLFKQISGFSILGLSILISLVSMRKRIRKLFQFGNYDLWRLVHVISGVIILAALLTHTGFRMGHNLNLYLMLIFSGLIISGAILGVTISKEHELPQKYSRHARKLSFWSHIFMLWPLPALLGFHILKTYYF